MKHLDKCTRMRAKENTPFYFVQNESENVPSLPCYKAY